MAPIVCSLFAEVRSLLLNKDAVTVETGCERVSLAALWEVIVAQLTAAAADRQRMAAVLSSCAVAVNEEFVCPDDFESVFVTAGDAVAIIPPVSGG